MRTTAIRTICSDVRTDPVFMRRINGWLTVFWIVMIPVSITLGWIHSVAYVSALSLWALVSSHWSGWQAARVEVEQVRQQQELIEHPPEERVVEAIVEQTNLERVAEAAADAAAGAAANSNGKVTETNSVTTEASAR
jgi:hypothetical protein